MNIFGERQDPEKFVPLVIKKVLQGEGITIHGDASGKPGSRKWLYARNQADALLYLLLHGVPGEKYHIGGEEHDNVDIAQRVSLALHKPLFYKVVDFHKDRPGHDRRYSLNDDKITKLGWNAPFDFAYSFIQAVQWTARNTQWLCE
jgi:dTDP-glucose 4,6-dehydratase